MRRHKARTTHTRLQTQTSQKTVSPLRSATALLCECPVGGPNIVLATSTSRATDCYTWHGSVARHTFVDAAHSRAKPSTLGSLSPETNLPVNLRLIVLCGVESVPGADGLLCSQRSYGTVGPNYIRPLLCQNYVNAVG